MPALMLHSFFKDSDTGPYQLMQVEKKNLVDSGEAFYAAWAANNAAPPKESGGVALQAAVEGANSTKRSEVLKAARAKAKDLAAEAKKSRKSFAACEAASSN